jgi:hypothetical protein
MRDRELPKQAPPGAKKPEARRPAAGKERKAAGEVGRKAAHEAVERAEREYPPIGGEYDRTPPGFERD